MKPLQDYMSIQKLPKKSLIEIPDGMGDKTKEPELFLVKDIGPGHYENGRLVEPTVKKHDTVFIMGPSAMIKVNDQTYHFARSRDVVAIF